MSVKERILVIRLAEKEKKNQKLFEDIKVEIKINKKQSEEK